jgi:hypothetical protein
LSVAKGFVEAMDGTITASDTPGGGLTILVDMAAPPLQERAHVTRAGDPAVPRTSGANEEDRRT